MWPDDCLSFQSFVKSFRALGLFDHVWKHFQSMLLLQPTLLGTYRGSWRPPSGINCTPATLPRCQKPARAPIATSTPSCLLTFSYTWWVQLISCYFTQVSGPIRPPTLTPRCLLTCSHSWWVQLISCYFTHMSGPARAPTLAPSSLLASYFNP